MYMAQLFAGGCIFVYLPFLAISVGLHVLHFCCDVVCSVRSTFVMKYTDRIDALNYT